MKADTLESYLSALASNSSTPGGGAVAAITGAQAAALIAMVCALTKTNESTAAEISEIHDRAIKAKDALMALAAEDARAFAGVMQAYGLPRTNDEEKSRRKEAIQLALRSAAMPPLACLKLAASLISDVIKLHTIGNKNLITDTGMAAILLPATISSAELNIRINLAGINDSEFKTMAEHEIQSALAETNPLTEMIQDIRKSLS